MIGVGHFGQHHARKLAENPEAALVAVVDRDRSRAAEVAARHGAEVLTDHVPLLGRVDVVSIATPPASHHALARDFLTHGAHVLVEKPITETVEEAEDLIRLAKSCGRVLQVGHIERFSAVGAHIAALVHRPLFIQAERVGLAKPRGEAVSAVLDLMIHDLDLVLSLVRSPIEWAHALGAPVVTSADDIASCRLQFANGCVADLTASRISFRSERKMRIFQQDSCTSVDFLKRRISVFRRQAEGADGAARITVEDKVYPPVDALEQELGSFLAAVRQGKEPVVSGEDGRRALEAALLVDRELQAHRRRVEASSG
ncbi:MAG TPA: Gfo/Idh/MocA family oxidoreductase [Caulobacteraceae bacterium]|nr:Gfo/Idh/MocA family oxidoreductase [Caulobacteraceae bacterium]